ncbi:2-oxoglutarate and iron-dependent oxygenase JMJD4-like isoform X1 [Microplitis mediator]|uniref:2-oxoglutarate and iron-dependent oxygenase JMJD4-like isoform X1 n=1 Tax=Microplitis mediator TaxID=375433 RepID=UPI0025551CAF|nr:2-oxoglutarate and iron-dependent oxygenase JMJD4-like isoform X1 [Microplitis mediator]
MELVEINNNNINNKLNDDNDLKVISNTRLNTAITYNDFFTQYLIKNEPCVFKCGITNEWPCVNKWIFNNQPNFKHLKQLYGNCKVPVANCKIKYYNAQQKNEMTIEKFMNYWEEYKNKNYSNELPVLYLKDWHCLRDNPNDFIYKVPKYFSSDWLNEYYLAHPELSDDYMFVYMGPKGSWTPLHVDVFTSFSWSANIVGTKRWLLFPPGEENNLCDVHGHLLYDIDSPEINNSFINHKKWFEIIQGPGEIVFVPSGWHHQVWNLEDTISINHNWINGCNILNVWKELKKALLAVMKEISDCYNMDNWMSQCQTILKASHGMDYLQFYEFLSFIIKKRLNSISSNKPCTNFDTWEFGLNHVLFDLKQAKCVLNCLIIDSRDNNIYDIVFRDNRPENLIQRIDAILI